jgi:hypothetical protein
LQVEILDIKSLLDFVHSCHLSSDPYTSETFFIISSPKQENMMDCPCDMVYFMYSFLAYLNLFSVVDVHRDEIKEVAIHSQPSPTMGTLSKQVKLKMDLSVYSPESSEQTYRDRTMNR